MRLADLPVPDTAAARAAHEVLTSYSAPSLVNHCVRSYLFAMSRALIDDIEVDVELLWVASLLHDVGLEPAFDSVSLPFEEAGGHVVRVLTTGAGWAPARRDRCARAVVAHMQGTDVAVEPEGHLLDVATGLDISGNGVAHWPAELAAEIVREHPRLDLAGRFTACIEDQAARKPGSAAGRAVRDGIAAKLAANPLERR